MPFVVSLRNTVNTVNKPKYLAWYCSEEVNYKVADTVSGTTKLPERVKHAANKSRTSHPMSLTPCCSIARLLLRAIAASFLNCKAAEQPPQNMPNQNLRVSTPEWEACV